MASALEHLNVRDLTKEELDAATECERQIADLKFIPSIDGHDVCDDPTRLGIASEAFYKKFNPWSKMGGRNIQLQAFRFDKRAKLPMYGGSMLFIPTVITGSATIAGQALKVGSYVELTSDVTVEPQVCCLVFRAN
ncbi:hypothetical protein V498_07934 [Pseudogymnoascus sp. VKM F-4517 (FW-2822)]|nr:hypothetical protein V498_07934 [Pseudogymnoascus sp. VKM F-4517 (FW-2822)]